MGADVSQAGAIPGQVVTRSPYIERTPWLDVEAVDPRQRAAPHADSNVHL